MTIATCGIYADYSGNDAMAAPEGGNNAQHFMVAAGGAPSGAKSIEAPNGSGNSIKPTTDSNEPPNNNGVNISNTDSRQAAPSNTTASSSTTTDSKTDATNSDVKMPLPENSDASGQADKTMVKGGSMTIANNSSSKSSYR